MRGHSCYRHARSHNKTEFFRSLWSPVLGAKCGSEK